MAGGAFARTIPRPPQPGHRSALQRRVRQAPAVDRHLQLRRLRRAAVHGAAEVQVRLRLAGVFRHRPRRRRAPHGQNVRHGAYRDCVRQLRRPFGTCVQGGGVPDPDG